MCLTPHFQKPVLGVFSPLTKKQRQTTTAVQKGKKNERKKSFEEATSLIAVSVRPAKLKYHIHS